jgi:hypothetical protein
MGISFAENSVAAGSVACQPAGSEILQRPAEVGHQTAIFPLGMPGPKGEFSYDMWLMVVYICHLPPTKRAVMTGYPSRIAVRDSGRSLETLFSPALGRQGGELPKGDRGEARIAASGLRPVRSPGLSPGFISGVKGTSWKDFAKGGDTIKKPR